MSWVIGEKEITCKDDLRGLPSTEVWATILYAATERYNIMFPENPMTNTLEDCRNKVRGEKCSSAAYMAEIPLYSSPYVNTTLLWADPEGADENGDFSGAEEIFPTINGRPSYSKLEPTIDLAWKYIGYMKRFKYLYLFSMRSFSDEDTTVIDNGLLSAYCQSTSIFVAADSHTRQGAWDNLVTRWMNHDVRSAFSWICAYGEINSYNAPLQRYAAYWYNTWASFSFEKKVPISLDVYVKKHTIRGPQQNNTYQLHYASPASENSFSLHFGEEWAEPVCPSSDGYDLSNGYEYSLYLGIIFKPEFEYS